MPSESHTKTVLIHFSGPDAPGLTAALTGILAQNSVNILDIGQAVVHEHLALGFLLEVPTGSSLTSLKLALQERARELGLQSHFRVIPKDAVKHWGFGLRAKHFIITVLGRSITAEQLAQVSAIISSHQMNIDRIDRLSRQLTPDTDEANACVELAVSGDSSREVDMRAEFLVAAQR